MGIQLISELEPKNSGSFALLDDKYIRGGLRVVETHDDLATIPADRLKDGMLAMVTTPAKVLYIYNQPTNTWSLFSAGGEGGSIWTCVGDNETIKITQNIDDWTQTISAINNIRTYKDYSVLPTENVSENEVVYCKADTTIGLTTHKRGFYYYNLSSTSWLEVNSTIEIDSALSDTSKRPVQNRVVTKALDEKVSKDDVDNVISKYSENPIQNKAVAIALEDVKNSKIMTAEEYSVLDNETKNDGSFYYISDTGEIYQNGIIYGGKQIFDVTQEEYDALTDEEKAINEYHCTDTGRIYINGILYGDKKSIEMTYEEYKQLEADDLVEEDVDYVIVSDEKGISLPFLLSDIDTNHGDSEISTYEVIETLKSDVTTLQEDITELANKKDIYTTDSIANTLYYACEYFGLDCRNQYQVLEIEVVDAKGQNLKFNSIYKHEVLHHAQVISENGITLKGIDTVGTIGFENASDCTIKVKHIDICPDSIGDTLVTVINRANKNALASDITSTYLIKDIAAGGANEKTVSFKIRKDYFATYYAKRTFLLSANVYSLGFSKPVISLVEIYRSATDSYNGYVVNLQDTRFTGVTVTVNGDFLEVDVTLNSYESSGCMVSCSSLSNVPIA